MLYDTSLRNKRRSLLLDTFANLASIDNESSFSILRFTMIRTNEKVLQTFQIEIVETLSNIVEVVAEDEQDALLKAQKMYRNEQVVLYPDDFIDTKFVVFQ